MSINSRGEKGIAKIFIIEDDKSVIRMYLMLLKMSGFDVIGTANNGKTAIEKFQNLSEKPDIILIDHRMPLKNGIETAKLIMNLDKDSKIIFTTADHSIKEEALSLGVIEFIEKPFLCERLIDSIHKALKTKSQSTLQN